MKRKTSAGFSMCDKKKIRWMSFLKFVNNYWFFVSLFNESVVLFI